MQQLLEPLVTGAHCPASSTLIDSPPMPLVCPDCGQQFQHPTFFGDKWLVPIHFRAE